MRFLKPNDLVFDAFFGTLSKTKACYCWTGIRNFWYVKGMVVPWKHLGEAL